MRAVHPGDRVTVIAAPAPSTPIGLVRVDAWGIVAP
jgi:hypothetical protein